MTLAEWLLFLNSLVNSGLNWEKNKDEKFSENHLITKYNLLKNIPREYNPIKGINFYAIYPNILYEFDSDNEKKKTERAKLVKKYS